MVKSVQKAKTIMQTIARDIYLQQLIDGIGDGFIKVITGIRRCGKSYLLAPLFRDYLLAHGVAADHIICANLEADAFSDLLQPHRLTEFVQERIIDDQPHFLLLDEVQLAPNFVAVLNGFLHLPHLDVYVTGSNSRFLSSDIATEFRGRSNEIRMYPLSFAEFMSAYDGDREQAWTEYYRFGGLPQIFTRQDESAKMSFLDNAWHNLYLNDIIERAGLKNVTELDALVEAIASSTGSLTNPYKLERSFKSIAGVNLDHNTIGGYLNRLEEAFIVEKAKRFDIKGKKYLNTPAKYYFTDPGVRNACLGFRQIEENHLMEGIIYAELKRRGYHVDIGAVEVRASNGSRQQLEIDFVASRGDRTYYIQSALTIADAAKRAQESRSLDSVDDHFTKIIIAKDVAFAGHEQNGIVTLNLFDFLLDHDTLDRYQ